MPRLDAYNDRFHKTLYRSSTFQVFVVSIIPKKFEDFRLIYKPDQMFISNVVTATQRIQVQNNTGCGNRNINSWMCTLAIASPRSTHARLRILQMDFNGPFSDMFVSSGIAVYNVIKNNSNLVAHFCSDTSFLWRSLALTGTENRLFVSFYAYSPFALLSCSVIAESSPCVGRFIGWHIRPSITMMPHEVHRVGYVDTVNVKVDINSQCVAIHIIFTPDEYIPLFYMINIIFDYGGMLSVHAYRESFAKTLRDVVISPTLMEISLIPTRKRVHLKLLENLERLSWKYMNVETVLSLLSQHRIFHVCIHAVTCIELQILKHLTSWNVIYVLTSGWIICKISIVT